MTESILDHPQVLRVLFHPRSEAGYLAPPGIRPVAFEVERGIYAGGRLHAAGAGAPLVLFFHGNGEIAADYDNLAPLYRRLGLSLLVVDYRGYGTSSGTPTGSNLLADAVLVWERLDDLLAEYGLKPARLYVMGRSLGSAAAIEVAVQAGDRLAGLIVESGFADTFALLARLGLRIQGAGEADEGFGNAAKMARIGIPTLVIHGQEDVLIPPDDGQALYTSSAAADKRLLLIPGAGHNDLMWVGKLDYFEAIRAFAAPD